MVIKRYHYHGPAASGGGKSSKREMNVKPFPKPSPCGVVGYTIGDNRYINVTNRCTLRCGFCPKFAGRWTVRGEALRLRREPTAEQMIEAAGDPEQFRQIVFCGLGEPTLRLYEILDVASRLRARGAHLRVNTDGLANLVFGRDVTPDFEGIVDALSVSLNAQNAEVYERLCRPPRPGCYKAMLDFVTRARDFVPDITLTAIDGLPDVDIAACRDVANWLGVKFRRRELGVLGRGVETIWHRS